MRHMFSSENHHLVNAALVIHINCELVVVFIDQVLVWTLNHYFVALLKAYELALRVVVTL
jgi:hypothetical protein